MPAEIEIKLPLEDAHSLSKLLAGLGARLLVPEESESNLLFDDERGSLWQAGTALRLRRSGHTATLTWKGPKQFRHGVREREELETRVDDPAAARRILQALGLRPVLRYDKRRTTWQLEDVLVMVDHTSAGSFVEIEGPEASVRRVTRRLEMDESRGIRESYATLVGERLQPHEELEWP
jgi:adenylate cyclase class 2